MWHWVTAKTKKTFRFCNKYQNTFPIKFSNPLAHSKQRGNFAPLFHPEIFKTINIVPEEWIIVYVFTVHVTKSED